MSDQRTHIEELMCRLFGWKEIGNDPWGSRIAYYEWLTQDIKPGMEAVAFYVTVFTRGSTYLAELAVNLSRATITFTELPSKTLLSMQEWARFLEDCIRKRGVPLRGEGEWLINYAETLHPAYVDWLLKRDNPFQSLVTDTEGIIAGRLALKEQVRRGYDSTLADYVVSESPALQRVLQEIAPNSALPNKDRSFERLWQNLRGKFHLREGSEPDVQFSIYELLKKVTTQAYEETPSAEVPDSEKADIEWEASARYFWAKIDPARLHDFPKRGAAYQRRVSQRLSHLNALDLLRDIQAMNLDGKLANYFSVVAKHDRKDEERRERAIGRHTVKQKEPDSRVPLDSSAYSQWDKKGRPAQESEETQHARLEDLNLPLEQLTAGERRVMQEVLHAAELGYTRSSKRGMSYRELWGKDYGKKIKMLERAKAKLKTVMPI